MLEPLLEILDDVSARLRKSPSFQFALASSSFRVYADATWLQQQLMTALQHRVIRAVDPPDLTVFAWHSHPSPLPRALPEWRVMERWARREPVRATGKDGMIFFDPIGGTVDLYDSGSFLAGAWFGDGEKLPIWIVAAPFLRLLDAWFTERGKILCHGAAIAKYGGAALIIGPGGAGKSTLALRALGASFDYLGDDYVLLEPAASMPVVHSVYASGKLLGADINAGFPAQATVIRQPDAPPSSTTMSPCFTKMPWLKYSADKSVLRVMASSILHSAPLVAIIEPCIGDNDWPRMEPISPGDALRTILPTSLRQLPGEEQKKLTIITQILTVPCFRLHLTRNHARNLAAIDEQLLTASHRLGLKPCAMKG
jgi:hypothetical protein